MIIRFILLVLMTCTLSYSSGLYPDIAESELGKRISFESIAPDHPIKSLLPYVGYMVDGEKQFKGRTNCGLVLIDAENDYALFPFHCLVKDSFLVRFTDREDRISCTLRNSDRALEVTNHIFPIDQFNRQAKTLGYSEYVAQHFVYFYQDIVLVKCDGAGRLIKERGLPNSPPIARTKEENNLGSGVMRPSEPMTLLMTDRNESESSMTKDVLERYMLTVDVSANLNVSKPGARIPKNGSGFNCNDSGCRPRGFPNELREHCEKYKDQRDRKDYIYCSKASGFHYLTGKLEFNIDRKRNGQIKKNHGPIFKGDSGGLAINPKTGKIIGLISSISIQRDNSGFVSIVSVYDILSQLNF